MPKKPRYQKTHVHLASREITLYVGSKVRSALAEVTKEMNLYHGVRLAETEVMEAVYEQGQKDGRKEIIDGFDTITSKVNYLPPGRPKKKRL